MESQIIVNKKEVGTVTISNEDGKKVVVVDRKGKKVSRRKTAEDVASILAGVAMGILASPELGEETTLKE